MSAIIKKGQLWQENRSGNVVEVVYIHGEVVRVKSLATGKEREAYLDRFGGDLGLDFWLKRDIEPCPQ